VEALHRVTIMDDAIAVIGAALIMALALGSERIERALLVRPVLAVGRASYALYLMHTVCLRTAIHMLHETLPLLACLAIAAAATAITTWAVHRWIEVPSIALGKRLSARMEAARHPAAARDQAA
jgi:peptidoglycan/LPS O-acetylase OafA/YrhL